MALLKYSRFRGLGFRVPNVGPSDLLREYRLKLDVLRGHRQSHRFGLCLDVRVHAARRVHLAWPGIVPKAKTLNK